MWTIIISLILVSYLGNIPYQKDHNGNKQDLSAFCAIFGYSLYVIMFNLESLYCILLNKIKSNDQYHNYNTRQSRSLHPSVGKGEAIYRSFSFHGVNIIIYGTRWQESWPFSDNNTKIL